MVDVDVMTLPKTDDCKSFFWADFFIERIFSVIICRRVFFKLPLIVVM
jgi:hypothetical protein